MMLRVSPSPAAAVPTQLSGAPATPAPVVRVAAPRGVASPSAGAACRAAGKGKEVLSGVVFQPFEEIKGELALVPQSPDKSLARHKFVDDCEAALNEQINVEYNASYAYHSLFAYFDRDNVALKGFAKFFKESSDEEREHAEKLMEYQVSFDPLVRSILLHANTCCAVLTGQCACQNKRGGRVRLQSIVTPLTEFDHPEKGDALYAMELALALEKLVNEKLHNLHGVATRCNDPQLTDFIESEFLEEQVEAINKISKYVAQLRRVGKGHGVWHFDQMLLEEEA
ncbi:Ferritin-1, chloroplastic [Zea mays]|uniref:Ferritin n=1 Tax=Zea mays TaxID=4577 RepID=A0A3L6EYL3_MAIZE|nr:Ferritin-1, chloroplastic [Zea mays]